MLVGLEINKRFVTIVVDILSIWKMFSMNEYAVSQKTINEHEKPEQEALN